MVEQRGVQDGGVQVAPLLGLVLRHGGVEQGLVGIGDEVVDAVPAGEQEAAAAVPFLLGECLQRAVQRAGDLLDLPLAAEPRQGLLDRQPVEHPVDGPHPQRIAGGVDQQDQAPVPGTAGQVPVLALEAQVHLPAVVAVGDEGAAGGQVAADLGDLGRVGDRPQPVVGAVGGGRGEQRLGADGAFDHVGRPAAAPVGEQQRFEVGPGGAHQADPVGDRPGHHVLVGEDHAGFAAADGEGADESALEDLRAAVGGGDALLVDVEGRLGVGGQDAFALPLAQQPGGVPVAGVAVGAVAGVLGLGAREDQPDHVVRVGGLQVEPSAGVDDVVRG